MTLQNLILLAMKASVALSVFSIGLEAPLAGLVVLARKPRLLAKSALAMNVAMPLLAAAISWTFDLPPGVEVALVALAVSPVPPVLPKKQIKAHGDPAYALGLLVAAAALAVVFIPLAVELLGAALGAPAHVSAWPIAKLVVASVLAPLVAGLAVGRLAPALAARVARPAAGVAGAVLALGFVAILVTQWPSIAALVGTGALLAIAGFVVVGLAAGHLLGGPDPHDRTVLALATATRHPGVALAIGAANPYGGREVLPAILVYLVAGAILAAPYVMWRKRAT